MILRPRATAPLLALALACAGGQGQRAGQGEGEQGRTTWRHGKPVQEVSLDCARSAGAFASEGASNRHGD